MTEKEIELILIEGLSQTPETRVDFYLSKAKENDCTTSNFCIALFEAYKRLEKYVNSFDYTTWDGIDEITGKKNYILKTINLLHFTNNKYKGFLDNENIIELLPGLSEMTKQLMQGERDKMTELLKDYKGPTKANKTGFKSSLTDVQIQTLFEQLKGKYIDINTNPDHFKAIFKNESLPDGFKPIKWLIGKNALRELLLFISGYKNKSNIIYLPDEAVKKIIPELFIDKRGYGIKLNKHKEGEYSNHYIKINAIIERL